VKKELARSLRGRELLLSSDFVYAEKDNQSSAIFLA